MKKLKLDLEALAVDTFEPAAREDDSRGTVRAHAADTRLGEYTCRGFGSCYYKCLGTVIGETC